MHEAQYFNPATRQWSKVHFPIPDASASTALIGDYVYQAVRCYGDCQKLVRTRITIEVGSRRSDRASDGLSAASISGGTPTVAVVAAVIASLVIVAIVIVGMKKVADGPASASPLFFSSRKCTDQVANDDSLEWDDDDVGMPMPMPQIEMFAKQQQHHQCIPHQQDCIPALPLGSIPQPSPALSRRISPKLGRKVTK